MGLSPKAVAPYDDDYVFRLGPECENLARDELRETEELRRHALTAMREWMDQNPKILKCRYDASFLLRFLRCKKFALPTVQETLERYVMLRECYDNSVFNNVRLEEEGVKDLLNAGLVFPLPKRDRLGRRVLLIQPNVIDVRKHTLRDLIRLFTITTDVLMEDEVNHINGFVYLIDAAGASMQLLTLVTPKETIRLMKNGEALVPMRHSLGVGYNIPSSMKFGVDFALSFLSTKLRSRVRQITDLASCPEIERPDLPKELGGSSMTIPEMIAQWKEELQKEDVRKLVQLNDEMRANTNLFSKREMSGEFSAKDDQQALNDQWGMESVKGSFRKMEVD